MKKQTTANVTLSCDIRIRYTCTQTRTLQSPFYSPLFTTVPTLLLTENYTFPGLSMTPKTFFQDSVVASNVKLQANNIYFKTFITSGKETVQKYFILLFTHWCSIHKRHVGSVKPRVNSRTFQDQTHFPGLFRSSKF